MIRKRSVILSVLFLSVGAAFAGTLWNAGGANLRSQLVPGSSIAIDDGDPGFSTTGQGWQRFQHALGTKGDLLSPASILDPSLSATWTFSRVQPGQYRVFVTYKAYSLLTNQAPYTVKDGSRVLSQTTVNQRADPAGNTFDGRNWALLGTYTFQGPTVSVTLKRPQGLTVNGVIADAARVELVSAAPAWAAAGGSAASSTVRMGSPTGGYSASFPAAGYTSAAAGGTGQPEGGTTPESGGMPVTGPYQPWRSSSFRFPQCPPEGCPAGSLCTCDPQARQFCRCCPGGTSFVCPNPFEEWNCRCQPLQCPPGYHIDPKYNTCIPDSVCGDGYLDFNGFPQEICETNPPNEGCPPGRICAACKECLLCGNGLLQTGETCETDFMCGTSQACGDACQCVTSSTALTANVTVTSDLASPNVTRTTIDSDRTRTSWVLPVRAGEQYDVYVWTQKLPTTMGGGKGGPVECPISYWRVYNGSQEVRPLLIAFGSPLCYTWPGGDKSSTWIRIAQVPANSTSIKVDHEPSPAPTPGGLSLPDPSRTYAIASMVRLVKTVADRTAPAPPGVTLIDDGDQGFRNDGGTWEVRNTPWGPGPNFYYQELPFNDDDVTFLSGTPSSPGGSAKWTFSVNPGSYRVFVRYRKLNVRNFINKDAQYAMVDGSFDIPGQHGTEMGRVTVDHSYAPQGPMFRNVEWEDLGAYPIASNRLTVVLRNPYGLSADAVRIEGGGGPISSSSRSSRSASSASSRSAATCAGEGEVISEWAMRQCCAGLTSRPNLVPYPQTGQCPDVSLTTICVKCGDGQCGLGENYCNCLQDCPRGSSSASSRSSAISVAASSSSQGGLCGNGRLDPGEQCDPRLVTFAPQCGGQPCNPETCQCPGGSSSASSRSSAASSSSRNCAAEGEIVSENNMRPCCTGLISRANVAPDPVSGQCPNVALTSTCTKCGPPPSGDGQCGIGENYCNCTTDCPRPSSSSASARSSSSASTCTTSPWTECAAGYSCLALCRGGQCWNASHLDCAPGTTPEYQGTCGNNTCEGRCGRCVGGSSSSTVSVASRSAGSSVSSAASASSQSSNCAREGEVVTEANMRQCCAGLRLWPNLTPDSFGRCPDITLTSVCIQQCGDGSCTLGENYCNCPQDCPRGSSSASSAQSSGASSAGFCLDSDGNDYEVAGAVKVENTFYRDECVQCNDVTCAAVKEWTCDGSQAVSEEKNCQEVRDGYVCTGGRCGPRVACGNNRLDTGEQCDGPNLPCPSNQVCSASCQCLPPLPSIINWSVAGSPYLVSTISNYGLFADGFYMYIAGGKDFWGSTKTEFRSNDGASWSAVGTLPQPLSNAAPLQVGYGAMLLGGLYDESSVVNWAFTTPSLLSASFQSNPTYALPATRYEGAALRVGNLTYFLGGTYKATPFGGSLLGSLLATLAGGYAVPYPSYDAYVHNGTVWSKLSARLPIRVTKNNAFTINGNLFIFDQSQDQKTLYLSNNGNVWARVGSLPATPSGTTFLRPIVHNGAVWLIGKNGPFAGSALATQDGLTWQTVTGAFPSSLSGFVPDEAVSYKGDIWILGSVTDYYVGGSGRNGKVLRSGAGGGPTCGNGGKEGTEQCDDGNTADGDGCSSTCQIESGWVCDGQPSKCAPWVSCSTGYECNAVPYLGNDGAWHCGFTGGLPSGCHVERNGEGCGNPDWCGTAQCQRLVCEGSSSSLSSSACGNGRLDPGEDCERGIINIVNPCRDGQQCDVKKCQCPPPLSSSSSSAAQDAVTLSSIDVQCDEVTVQYSKNFDTCVHLLTSNLRPTHTNNVFCQRLGPVTVPLSEFNNLFQIGGSYKLCHGNNYNVCSALVAVTGTTHCAGASSSASSAACTDSDGGKNYYVRGTITNYLPFGTTPFPYASDVCFKDNNQNPAIDPNILLEGYCGDDGYGHLEQYTCPYGCQDGVCLPSQSSSSLACTPAGQTHPVIPGASCCPGLTDIGTNKPNVDGSCPPPPLGVVLCAKCGNGECALGENYCNCPADCKKPCAGEGEKVYGSPQFGPTHCCSKNAGIKPSTFLVGDTCVAPNDGSLGTCVDNWWRTCGDGTCGTGEDKCNCPADCRCPSPTPPLCQNGILVPQLGPDENGCKLPPVCCEGANAPQAQCQLNLSCGSGTCRITSCTCS